MCKSPVAIIQGRTTLGFINGGMLSSSKFVFSLVHFPVKRQDVFSDFVYLQNFLFLTLYSQEDF